jgi:hypothetical protein
MKEFQNTFKYQITKTEVFTNYKSQEIKCISKQH